MTGALHPDWAPEVGHLLCVNENDLRSWVSPRERTERLGALRARRIARARVDFGAFTEYVFADDKTGEPYRQQWFHDQWGRAWDTDKRVFICAPRDHGKTSQIVSRVLFELGRNPNLRIKIACAADGRAKERLFEIRQHIEANPRLKDVFPGLRPSPSEWSKHKLVVERGAQHRDASVEALGITATATGGRADLLIADDVVDRRNALSMPGMREAIKLAWKSDWTNLLEPEGKIWYICTLWHKDDLSHELLKNPAFTSLFYAVDQNFGSLWPGKWCEENLRTRYAEIGSVEFNRAFRNQAIDLDTALVREDWFAFSDLASDPRFLERLDHLVYFTSYDTAGTPSGLADQDYQSSVTIAVDPDERRIFVVDAWHARCSVKAMAARVIDEARQFLPHRVLIEKAGQAALDEWVANEAPDLIPIIEVTKPRISKAQRLLAVTPLLEAGRVVFAHHLNPNGDAWNPSRGSLIHELLDFPFGKHDDMVDGFSQALDGARRYFLDHWASRGDNVIEVHVGSERRDASGRKYRY